MFILFKFIYILAFFSFFATLHDSKAQGIKPEDFQVDQVVEIKDKGKIIHAKVRSSWKVHDRDGKLINIGIRFVEVSNHTEDQSSDPGRVFSYLMDPGVPDEKFRDIAVKEGPPPTIDSVREKPVVAKPETKAVEPASKTEAKSVPAPRVLEARVEKSDQPASKVEEISAKTEINPPPPTAKKKANYQRVGTHFRSLKNRIENQASKVSKSVKKITKSVSKLSESIRKKLNPRGTVANQEENNADQSQCLEKQPESSLHRLYDQTNEIEAKVLSSPAKNIAKTNANEVPPVPPKKSPAVPSSHQNQADNKIREIPDTAYRTFLKNHPEFGIETKHESSPSPLFFGKNDGLYKTRSATTVEGVNELYRKGKEWARNLDYGQMAQGAINGVVSRFILRASLDENRVNKVGFLNDLTGEINLPNGDKHPGGANFIVMDEQSVFSDGGFYQKYYDKSDNCRTTPPGGGEPQLIVSQDDLNLSLERRVKHVLDTTRTRPLRIAIPVISRGTCPSGRDHGVTLFVDIPDSKDKPVKIFGLNPLPNIGRSALETAAAAVARGCKGYTAVTDLPPQGAKSTEKTGLTCGLFQIEGIKRIASQPVTQPISDRERSICLDGHPAEGNSENEGCSQDYEERAAHIHLRRYQLFGMSKFIPKI